MAERISENINSAGQEAEESNPAEQTLENLRGHAQETRPTRTAEGNRAQAPGEVLAEDLPELFAARSPAPDEDQVDRR